jgi:hypothetical protein
MSVWRQVCEAVTIRSIFGIWTTMITEVENIDLWVIDRRVFRVTQVDLALLEKVSARGHSAVMVDGKRTQE